MDNSKYVRYTPEQVEALERVYGECPKPSSLRRQQLVREFPILANIEPKQIKVWFQNRRCREKQRKESSRLQAVNRKLNAMNKLLMEENDRLQKQVSNLVYENGYMRTQLHTPSIAATDNSCESVALTIQQQNLNPTHLHSRLDASSPAGLLAIAEETMAEFLAKATGTAVDWVQMIGMKPGPDSIGIIAVSHNCTGIAARACGLVNLEPAKVASILKDRGTWYRGCRSMQTLSVLPTANRGTAEIIYMQTYAPTTLAAARDFLSLRYSTTLEDGSLLICERSLSSPSTLCPNSSSFVRAHMLPSGYLIRPCDGNGSILHIVDHFDLDPSSVPEVLRPLYESSKILAQKSTIAALRHVRQIANEATGEVQFGGGRQPAMLRSFSQRLSKGFNEAVNGFPDDGWSTLESDGVEDVTISVNSGVLCAKASMLLQNVHPAVLVRFLREHRSEWADSPCLKDDAHVARHVILPLGQTVEHEEFLEVVKLQSGSYSYGEVSAGRDAYLLQLCSGVDESIDEGCAQMIFAPIDDTFADDAPLLPSGFSIIPLDSKDGSTLITTTRTLNLASALENGPGLGAYKLRSVLTIAFQFTYEAHVRDEVVTMARQYVHAVVSSVQRVAMAIAPTSCHTARSLPEASTLARWICKSYRSWYGRDLFSVDGDCQYSDGALKMVWHHSDAIMCCSLKNNVSPAFTFANQAGLDMLETSLVALQDIMLDKILDESGRKVLCTVFPKIMSQGFACLPPGICVSSMGRPVAYEQAVAWKVLDDENANHCIALMFVNWSFV